MKKIIFILLINCISLLVVAQDKLVALSPATTVKDGQSYLYSFSTNVPGASIVYGSLKVTAANLSIHSSQPSGSNDRLSIIYTNNNVITTPKTGTLTFTAKYILNGNVGQEYTLPPLNISVTIQPPPPVTPPINNEYSGAIILTPGSSTQCVQQTAVNFNNSTITQWAYQDLGDNGGYLPMSYALGDLWYKFVSSNNSHEILISSAPANYFYRIELLTLSASEFKIIDGENGIDGGPVSIKTSGLSTGQTYYVRLILSSRFGNSYNKNISSSICINTPSIVSHSLKAKLRYDNLTDYVYEGNTIGLSYLIPENIPESDLSFDWRLVNSNPLILEGAFLYEEEASRFNNGTYSLLNVRGRKVKIGFDPKSSGNAFGFWTFGIDVRIKQVSTNTYITDWIRAGGAQTEL